MTNTEYTFEVEERFHAPASVRFAATLGSYDLGAPVGLGETPADAIIALIEENDGLFEDHGSIDWKAENEAARAEAILEARREERMLREYEA